MSDWDEPTRAWLADLVRPTEQEQRMMRRPAPPAPHACHRCGEEVLYEPSAVNDLHTRAPLDEWDNLYRCADQYVIRVRKQSRCASCNALIVAPLPVDAEPPTTCWLCQKIPPGQGERA